MGPIDYSALARMLMSQSPVMPVANKNNPLSKSLNPMVGTEGARVPSGGGGRAIPSYEARGNTLGELYHGGPTKIQQIDPSKLGSRDSGFYGKGLYVTKAPHYAKSYGPRISKFEMDKDSRVLMSSLKPQEAPKELVEAVRADYIKSGLSAARARGKERQFMEEANAITENPLNWKNAIIDYANRNGYDAIHHSPGEIVIMNTAKVRSR